MESLLKASRFRNYQAPSLDSPTTIFSQMMQSEDGRVVAAVVVRSCPEITIVLDPGLTPVVKLSVVRQLHELLPRLKEKHYDEAICFMPPEIEVPYSRRLRSLGWLRQWACFALKF